MKNSIVILLFAIVSVFASDEALAKGKYEKVVATNAWTAAYAKAAGFDNVDVLTPSSVIHPSEYELTPNEIKNLLSADLILYGGYEVMGKFIEENMNSSKTSKFKLVTNYNYSEIEKQVKTLAKINGTLPEAVLNLDHIRKAFSEASSMVKKTTVDKETILVHFFQVPFAEAMSMNVTATFGPEPLEAFQIRQMLKTNPTFVIDNFHNSVAAPLLEIVSNLKIVKLLNFPGQFGTETIQDVILFNAKAISEALKN